MITWAQDAIFYHIYPLGLCAAPRQNDFSSPAVPRLEKIYGWLDHIQDLGANAIYLGPVFESSAHGYDTVDYFHVDRRLGSDETLAQLSQEIHRRGMRLVLDAVFNHVGRDFWAFYDLRQHGAQSAYRDWFAGLRFDQTNSFHDPFSYEGWNGHYSLVKLDLGHPQVRDHLLQAVRSWIERFDVDGLRLDAADCLDHAFMQELAGFCRGMKPDFWLMGEVVHGDYRAWANPAELDSVTNYECYKGLYSSHNTQNFFEIAYSLNRQFGEGGLYRDLGLYNFADNHDVSRVASVLKDPAYLNTLYTLLFTMPGIPSLYYGSEFGLSGAKDQYDYALRPALDLASLQHSAPQPGLAGHIHTLANLRRRLPALRYGDYRQQDVQSSGLAFSRQTEQDWALVLLNGGVNPLPFKLNLPAFSNQPLVDALNGDQPVELSYDRLEVVVEPHSAKVIVRV